MIKGSSKSWLFLIISILVFTSCGSGGPKPVGEKFLRAMKAGDYATAKLYATEKTRDNIDLIKSMDITRFAGDPSEIVIDNTEIRGDHATLHYSDDGAPKTLDLVKIDGEWKVSMDKAMDDIIDPGTISKGINNAVKGIGNLMNEALDEIGDQIRDSLKVNIDRDDQ